MGLTVGEGLRQTEAMPPAGESVVQRAGLDEPYFVPHDVLLFVTAEYGG
jgi:hypothetical protein